MLDENYCSFTIDENSNPPPYPPVPQYDHPWQIARVHSRYCCYFGQRITLQINFDNSSSARTRDAFNPPPTIEGHFGFHKLVESAATGGGSG